MSRKRTPKKCIHCNRSEDTEFYEIFGEVGIELQLDALLEHHFQLKVTSIQGEQPVLCDECVNQLIELFDLAEKQKEQESLTPDEDDNTAEDGSFLVKEEHTNLSSSPVNESDCDRVSDAADDATKETFVYAFDEEKDDFFEFESDNNATVVDYDECTEVKEETIEEFTELQTDFDENTHDEFDGTVLQLYADATINSNLEDLQLEREIICNICSETLTQHQDLLLHIQELHNDENGFSPCVLYNCQQLFENKRLLARHIVLKHYDLRGVPIYGSCSNCGMSYSNFIDFNKHSCCKTLKYKGRSPNYCRDCKTDFPTFRRYRFHMQFHMKNPRPKVCLLCDSFFKDGEEFFEHVHYDHEPPHEMMCTKCDRMYKSEKLFDAHMASHNSNFKSFQCSLCSKAYSRKQWLKVHMQTHEELKCEVCNKILSTKDYYRNHIKLHQPDTDVQISFCTLCGQSCREKEDLQEHIGDANSRCYKAEIKQGFVDVVYFCEYCEIVFKGKAELKQHRATGVHDDNLFRCHACPATFDKLRKLQAHFKTHNNYLDWRKSLPLYRKYMCDVGDCEQSYAVFMSLQRHKILKHKELRLICAGCNTKFTNKDEFDTHSEKCQKDGMYDCQFCGKQCPSKMSRSVHIARSHNNKNFSCSSCKSSFKDEETLAKHVEFVHVAMECEICRKKMKNKRSLLLHERVKHANEKRYFCEICQKGYYKKSDMEVHERTKHSAISYVCEKCPFTTKYKNSLDIHMARHNNDLPFECSICNKRFARKRVMELHVKCHQMERELVCSDYSDNGCTASFVTKHLLNIHIKDKHSRDLGHDPASPVKKRSRKNKLTNFVHIDNASDHDNPDYKPTTEQSDGDEPIDFVNEQCVSQELEIAQELATEYRGDVDGMKLENNLV